MRNMTLLFRHVPNVPCSIPGPARKRAAILLAGWRAIRRAHPEQLQLRLRRTPGTRCYTVRYQDGAEHQLLVLAENELQLPDVEHPFGYTKLEASLVAA